MKKGETMEHSDSNSQRNSQMHFDDALTEVCRWLEGLAPELQNHIDLIRAEIENNTADTNNRGQILVVRIRGGAPILRKDQSETFGFVI